MFKQLRKRFKSWLLLYLMTDADELDDQAKFWTLEKILHDICEHCDGCEGCPMNGNYQYITEDGRKGFYLECHALPYIYRRARKAYGLDKEE